MAKSVGDTSVALEDILVNASRERLKPFWYFCVHTSLVVAHSLSLPPVVQNFGLVFGCLHVWDHQENVVVGFPYNVSPILDDI